MAKLLKHSGNMLLMGGDISNMSLGCARAYGDIAYINNQVTKFNTAINLILDAAQWQTRFERA